MTTKKTNPTAKKNPMAGLKIQMITHSKNHIPSLIPQPYKISQ